MFTLKLADIPRMVRMVQRMAVDAVREKLPKEVELFLGNAGRESWHMD